MTIGFAEPTQMTLDRRLLNRLKSPKRGGSSDVDSIPYLQELGIDIIEQKQPIQFADNTNEHIHRWSPYVQGFSAAFVQSQFDLYAEDYDDPVVLDPFAGSGTVLVQAKLNSYRSYGTELVPLLQFIANTKTNTWDVYPNYLLRIYESMPKDKTSPAPAFLKSTSHFNKGVLSNLEILKGGIEAIEPKTEKQRKVKDLIRVAFSAILIDASNLKRGPCLGYAKTKHVDDTAPFVLLYQKIHHIASDLQIIRNCFKDKIHVESEVFLANARDHKHARTYDLVITSPPYMNGLDYVINYKIETGWLGFAESHKDLKRLKDSMVACDNVSKGLIRDFAQSEESYTNEWLEEITHGIEKNIEKRGFYRRQDMADITHKYFDDMYHIMKAIVPSINPGGRFILVVGDSLIADTYVPTDLLLARMGVELGLKIKSLVKARGRRSGQIRSYKLRETIITLRAQ